MESQITKQNWTWWFIGIQKYRGILDSRKTWLRQSPCKAVFWFDGSKGSSSPEGSTSAII